MVRSSPLLKSRPKWCAHDIRVVEQSLLCEPDSSYLNPHNPVSPLLFRFPTTLVSSPLPTSLYVTYFFLVDWRYSGDADDIPFARFVTEGLELVPLTLLASFPSDKLSRCKIKHSFTITVVFAAQWANGGEALIPSLEVMAEALTCEWSWGVCTMANFAWRCFTSRGRLAAALVVQKFYFPVPRPPPSIPLANLCQGSSPITYDFT